MSTSQQALNFESEISIAELQSRLWDAANVLRGPIDAADFKAYIFPLLFFKRITQNLHLNKETKSAPRTEILEV